MTFVLNPKLESDSVLIKNLSLCTVRLHKNAAFPWLMLIPQRPNLVEILDLNDQDRATLYKEIEHCARVLQKHSQPTKLNIANLGNVVPQLHIHVIARFATDPAWPNPVWNSGMKAEYGEEGLAKTVSALRVIL